MELLVDNKNSLVSDKKQMETILKVFKKQQQKQQLKK